MSESNVLPQQTGEIEVPISPLSHIYAKRSLIAFDVCGGGVLLAAAQRAADLWNAQLTGRVRIALSQSDCATTARIRNDRSELYYSEPGSLIHRAVGLYQGILDRERGVISEEDITVDSEISELIFLTNIIAHELGHALGLNHAQGATCRQSVMAEYACRSYPTPPTDVDVEAAKRIYKTTHPPLQSFDLNSNGRIDDEEFFRALDRWLASDIGDATFFDVIDAWIEKRAIALKPERLSPLSSAERVEIYDLSGNWVGVYPGRSIDRALKRLPRETYIYRAYFFNSVQMGLIVKS